MSENITFPNDPPVDGDQFTIGNTTYAWDSAPGVWRAFVTAASSSGGGGGGGTGDWISDFSAASVANAVTQYTAEPIATFSNFAEDTWVFLEATHGTYVTFDNDGNAMTVQVGYVGTDGLVQEMLIASAVAGNTSLTNLSRSISTTAGLVTNNGNSSVGLIFAPAGSSIVPDAASVAAGNASGEALTCRTWPAGGAGGSSTTVNIGGSGGGLSLPTNDEILEQTITTSGTLVAGDFTGTGPAWVVVSGGAGGSAGCGSNGGGGGAGSGGDGGAYAFFLDDVMDLVGGVLTAGAGGAGGAFIFGAIDPGVTICNDGTNGSTTTFVIDGTTITCTGGIRGRGSSASATNGTDGTSSASGGTPPTELTITELNEAIDAYWQDFVIANQSTGALTIASFLASLDGAQGPAGVFQNTTANVPPGGGGQNGGLYILYQNQ